MKELYIEGVAIHDGPESCVGVREGGGEALTGARAGRAIEPRNQESGVPTLLQKRKATSSAALSRAAVDPARSENPGMHGISMRENREIPSLARPADRRVGPLREGRGRKPEMHERGKSDSPVVPAKPPNNAGRPAAEVVEERGLAKGNTDDKTRPGHRAGPRAKWAGSCA